MSWKSMQPEAPREQPAPARRHADPQPDFVRPEDPDPGHVRALAHYSAMLVELRGPK